MLLSGITEQTFGSDNVGSRTLSGASYINSTGMTVESCINFCSTGANAYIYAGVEYADECCQFNHPFDCAIIYFER